MTVPPVLLSFRSSVDIPRDIFRFKQGDFLIPHDIQPQSESGEKHDDDHEDEDGAQGGVHIIVEDHLPHFRHGFRRRQYFPVIVSLFKLDGVGHEADGRIGMEDFLQAGRQRDEEEPPRRQQGHPRVLFLAHLKQDGRAEQ